MRVIFVRCYFQFKSIIFKNIFDIYLKYVKLYAIRVLSGSMGEIRI